MTVKIRMNIKTGNLRKRLQKIQGVLKGSGGSLEPAFKSMGIEMFRLFAENFKKDGALAGGWEPLSPLTKMLRRRGAGKKIADWKDMAAKPVQILRDTGILRASLTAGLQGSGKVFRTKSLGFDAGTSVPYAKLHQAGGQSTFNFDADMKKRFQKNVLKVLPRAKPRTTPTGKHSKAKKNWNPFFFKMWNALEKKSGQSVKIPARPIVFPPTGANLQRLTNILDRHIDRAVK